MGKKGNGFNVFESYVAAGLSSQSTTSAGNVVNEIFLFFHVSNVNYHVDNEPIPLPDSMVKYSFILSVCHMITQHDINKY